MAEPNVSNVIIGPALVYVAPVATAFPSLASKPAAAAWVTPWAALGYTEDGVSLTTTPAKKDFTPDETITPIKTIVTGVASELKVTLWEATLENLSKAIALSSLSNPGLGIKTLSIGSGNSLTEFAIGVQGPGVGGVDGRVITIWRAIVASTVEQKYSRKDISKVACTFTLLTDSTKAVGLDVYQIVDFGAGS